MKSRKRASVWYNMLLTALKSEIDAAKAKAPESVKGDLQAIDDQVVRVLENIKKD